MARDHYVSARSEESIAHLAYRLRDAHGSRSDQRFNIIDFVEKTFPRELQLLKKDPLHLAFYDIGFKEDDPAFVSFNPRTLNSDRKIWADARDGEPNPRFVIGHEIGHVVLHDHSAKAFSKDKADMIKFADNEQSAEWQANTFAGHFLLPDAVLEGSRDAVLLASVCQIPERLALERISAFEAKQIRKHRKFEGGFCSSCGNFSLVPEGTLLKCTTVGCGNAKSAF
jgi:Zn-dependent peptidase ImmA (M78 family)